MLESCWYMSVITGIKSLKISVLSSLRLVTYIFIKEI